MENFRDYARKNGENGDGGNGGRNTGEPNGKNSGGLFKTVSRLAKDFDGKSSNDLLRAIYKEAERGKRAGTLSNAEIDNFVALLSPALDGKKRLYLKKLAEDLKKI